MSHTISFDDALDIQLMILKLRVRLKQTIFAKLFLASYQNGARVCFVCGGWLSEKGRHRVL
jgi:hypothetical protein